MNGFFIKIIWFFFCFSLINVCVIDLKLLFLPLYCEKSALFIML